MLSNPDYVNQLIIWLVNEYFYIIIVEDQLLYIPI